MPEPQANSAALLRAAREGDDDAFAAFYLRWFDRMARDVARLSGRDESTCLDVVQDVMTRIARNPPDLPGEADVARWLRRAAMNAMRDVIRQEHRRANRERARATGKKNPATPSDHETVRSALDALDPSASRLLRLRFGTSMTLAQIGAVLGIGPGATDGRVRRALRDMRTNIEEQHSD